jgi:hypothetical protein
LSADPVQVGIGIDQGPPVADSVALIEPLISEAGQSHSFLLTHTFIVEDTKPHTYFFKVRREDQSRTNLEPEHKIKRGSITVFYSKAAE